MSYILDALKRSDSERSMGNIPSLRVVQERDLPTEDSQWTSILLGMLLALLLVACVLGWVYRQQIPVYAERLPVVGQALAGLLGNDARPDANVARQSAPPVRTSVPSQSNDLTAGISGNNQGVNAPVTSQGVTTQRPATQVATTQVTDMVPQPQQSEQPQAQPISDVPINSPTISNNGDNTNYELGNTAAAAQTPQAQTIPIDNGAAQPNQPTANVAVPGNTYDNTGSTRVLEPVDMSPTVSPSGSPSGNNDPVAEGQSGWVQPIDSESTTQPAEQPNTQVAAVAPRYKELTSDVRRQLPPLTINVVSYSPKPTQRFVMINQEFFYEGEVVSGGIILDEILPDGLVIDFRGELYLLRP